MSNWPRGLIALFIASVITGVCLLPLLVIVGLGLVGVLAGTHAHGLTAALVFSLLLLSVFATLIYAFWATRCLHWLEVSQAGFRRVLFAVLVAGAGASLLYVIFRAISLPLSSLLELICLYALTLYLLRALESYRVPLRAQQLAGAASLLLIFALPLMTLGHVSVKQTSMTTTTTTTSDTPSSSTRRFTLVTRDTYDGFAITDQGVRCAMWYDKPLPLGTVFKTAINDGYSIKNCKIGENPITVLGRAKTVLARGKIIDSRYQYPRTYAFVRPSGAGSVPYLFVSYPKKDSAAVRNAIKKKVVTARVSVTGSQIANKAFRHITFIRLTVKHPAAKRHTVKHRTTKRHTNTTQTTQTTPALN